MGGGVIITTKYFIVCNITILKASNFWLNVSVIAILLIRRFSATSTLKNSSISVLNISFFL